MLELRFGFAQSPEGASLEQIGKKLGLTRERIRQLESTALGRLEERLAHRAAAVAREARRRRLIYGPRS